MTEKVSQIIENLLNEIGEDTSREGLKDTPKRVAKSFSKLYGGYGKDPKKMITVFDGENYDEMIICRDIDFFSTCEHHMLPFYGKAHIGYIPQNKIVGLSKLPRLVEIFSRRLQNQERLTSQIANSLNQLINPKGVAVVLEGKHFCMISRGVQKQNSVMTTSSCKGIFKKNSITRQEFLNLIKR